MSFFQYYVRCNGCKKRFKTAFGVVGTTQIATPLDKCPECGGTVKSELKIPRGKLTHT